MGNASLRVTSIHQHERQGCPGGPQRLRSIALQKTYGGEQLTISIRSNSDSLRAQRILGRTSSELSSVLTRLGSGERINRASDDAGGLSISESLKSRAKVALTAMRNANDGLSALNIADSALGEITGILGRMSELAEQSANGTISNAQRSTLNKEFRALGGEISRLAEVTVFNGRELILQRPSGGGDPGISSGDNIEVQGTVVVILYEEYQSNSIELQVGFTSSLASRIETESINASLTGLGLGRYYQVTGQPEREYLNQNIRNVSEARTALTSVITATERISTYRG